MTNQSSIELKMNEKQHRCITNHNSASKKQEIPPQDSGHLNRNPSSANHETTIHEGDTKGQFSRNQTSAVMK